MEKSMQSDELNFGSGNLYSALPIPAYQVLAKAKEYNAQRVLMCLVSHMGYNNRCVWPSYPTIMGESGVRNRNSVSRSISTLVEFGFVKTFQIRAGKRQHTKYFLQGCCWNSSLMNEKARQYRMASHKCLACLKYLQRGHFFSSGDAKVHYNCGGFVIPVKTVPMPAVQEAWRDRISEMEARLAEEEM